MASHDELLAILDGVCADICDIAIGSKEVAERLVVVASGDGSVEHEGGTTTYGEGNVVAFVNDSGVPFIEQADELLARTLPLRPEAVLLAGSALTGRPGGGFRRILAVQLFSSVHGIRMGRVAPVEETNGIISAVAPWRDVKAGPPVWAERLLGWMK